MEKITASSTKPEILAALAEAEKKQDLLHTEITGLNISIEELEKLSKEKSDAIIKLEELAQEDGMKKQGLIKEIASQASDIELARKKTEKYVEVKTALESAKKELESAKSELFAANKKIELLTYELAGLKSRALPPKKKRKFFSPLLKTAAACSIVVFGVVAMIALYGYVGESDFPLYFVKHDNGITTISHNPNGPTIKSDGDVDVSNDVNVCITKWAEKAGFDSVLYGNVSKANEVIILSESDESGIFVTMDKLVEKLDTLGFYNTLALVNNPENIKLPKPFKVTSEGELKFYEGRRKVAGIVPVFWGKDKKVFYISSDNIAGFITSTGIFMDDGITKTSVPFEAVKPEVKGKAKEVTTDDSSKEPNVVFSKLAEWKENITNLR